MKKLLLLVALFVATVSNAQKGSVFVGGNVGFSSEKIGDTNRTTSNLFQELVINSPIIGELVLKDLSKILTLTGYKKQKDIK